MHTIFLALLVLVAYPFSVFPFVRCAQYIKHMIKITTDKEGENQKLNKELDEKRRKLERENEEKALQGGRSDPESVTSSLTSDTTMSTARHKQEEETSGESGGDDTKKKRKLPSNGNREGGSSGDDSNNNNDADNANHSNSKKHRITSSEATSEESSGDDNRGGSGTGSGSGNSRTGSGSGNSGSGGISKTISSVSELTDSNRGSSSNNSGSGGGSSDDLPTEQDSRESASGNREDGVVVDQPSTSSISSDAAVASEKTSRDRNTGHKDVVFNNDKRMSRKRPPEEVTSLERTFELNYEEVFHKSNIPQLIASTSGKIVTWNECFSKATGYRKSEIERMTIFSLVKPENLANFFEIVAAALRPDDEEIAKEKKNGVVVDRPSTGSISSDAAIASEKTNDKKETEESSNNSTSTNSSGEDKDLKQSTISESTSSSQDSLSGRDTVICSNNEKDGGDQGDMKNTDGEKNGCTNVDGVVIKKKEESSSRLEGNGLKNLVSGNSANEESSSNFTEEVGASKIDADKSSSNSANEESSSNSTEEEAAGSGNSTNEETSSNSTVDEGTSKSNSGTSHDDQGDNSTKQGIESKTITLPKEGSNGTTSNVENGEEDVTTKNDANDDHLTRNEGEELMSKRLLNYTAMTLPCIDFPAMKKRNQAAVESNAVMIPPLHVTVSLDCISFLRYHLYIIPFHSHQNECFHSAQSRNRSLSCRTRTPDGGVSIAYLQTPRAPMGLWE
jgi:PAS domain S-box-containing protein